MLPGLAAVIEAVIIIFIFYISLHQQPILRLLIDYYQTIHLLLLHVFKDQRVFPVMGFQILVLSCW
jgi:hypothetical protein